jgi:hypothetical protein
MLSNWDLVTTKPQGRHLSLGQVGHEQPTRSIKCNPNLVVLGSLHIGGGIDENNALYWLEHGAEKVSLSGAAPGHS